MDKIFVAYATTEAIKTPVHYPRIRIYLTTFAALLSYDSNLIANVFNNIRLR